MATNRTFRGVIKPFGAKGHFNEPQRHSMQAKGYKTGHSYFKTRGVEVTQPIFTKFRMGHNPLELTLYIPSTQGESELISKERLRQRIENAERKMSKLFGGYTEVEATGGWVNDEKKLVQEPQGKVTSYTTEQKLVRGRKRFEAYVKRIKKDYDQSSIAIEYEGDLFFYEPKNKK